MLAAGFNSPDAANLTGVNAAVLICLFSGFVPKIGDTAVWAYSHWAQRSYLAAELKEGYGVSDKVFNLSVSGTGEVLQWQAMQQ